MKVRDLMSILSSPHYGYSFDSHDIGYLVYAVFIY